MAGDMGISDIGLVGLAVMGQNLALNIAEKGFSISVHNRTASKIDDACTRAEKEGLGARMNGYPDVEKFVKSIKRPRSIIILVKAGAPVDATIDTLLEHLEEGDAIIDGGNEWYENTERRQQKCLEKGIRYMGMGVSGGESGARFGPSLMPGGDEETYKRIEPIVTKAAAQVDDGPCVTFIGPGGSGNFVKMVHNGIEYGDMQLIAEAYDILKVIGGLSNEKLAEVFDSWNKGELDSFLVQISAEIFRMKDDLEGEEGEIIDKILDKTGMKGTGKWTVQQAAELSIAAPTIAAALDSRFLSGLKPQRVLAEKFYDSEGLSAADSAGGEPVSLSAEEVDQLIQDVRMALYASKICSYAQGMNLIRAKSVSKEWNLNLGELARIWKGGCIIRAKFLDRIRQAYSNDPDLHSLLFDKAFASELVARHESWRKVVSLAISNGIGIPGMMNSLCYFDTYRRGRLPANLIQAQRDFFGSHTYERVDKEGAFHTLWPGNSADSITTSGYTS